MNSKTQFAAASRDELLAVDGGTSIGELVNRVGSMISDALNALSDAADDASSAASTGILVGRNLM